VEGQGYLYSHPLPPGEIECALRAPQSRAEPRRELVASNDQGAFAELPRGEACG
jgi:hypothetical protein